MTTTLLNNRYQIIQVLGAGGFGETFLAEDTYLPSRRRCVIKQLKPITNDPQMYQLIQQRFQREAATLESLGEGSDQIPKLYAYFSENGQFYLVQEWIQGQTLLDKIATEGLLRESAVREILISLLLVLDYVHSKGIIYRDIKPDNIILRQSDSKPVVIDFGAVKETMSTGLNSQGKPMYSIVLGTPGFMAPEQASGRPIYASDLYSLGMTAIYLLTGKLPQEFDPDPTEEMLWRQYAQNVSPRLAAVLDKAIQYHPRDRYTTALKMLDALQSVSSTPHPQPATQVTVVMPPLRQKVSNQPASVIPPQTTSAINHASSPRNQQKILILGSLLLGSLIGAGIIFSALRNQLPPPLIITSQTPESTSESPIATSTPTVESPELVPGFGTEPPAPLTAESPLSPDVSLPEPNEQQPALEEAGSSLPEPNEQQPAPEEADSSLPQPNEQQPAPEEAGSSLPQPNEQQPAQAPSTPANSAPQQQDENQQKLASNTVSKSVPGFPTGTSESSIKAALGNPTKTSKGYFPNTRALLYELKPNQITLGYIVDRSSGQLRQTEVSFAQSIEPEMIQTTLQKMLGGNSSADINEGLQQVYQRRANTYSFNTNGLKGVIERNDRDRIYIGVWDRDFH